MGADKNKKKKKKIVLTSMSNLSWCTWSRPGKSGFLSISSIKMHPTDHTSIAAVYSDELSSNSGALYHLVTTYSVMKSVSEVVRASPKSQILRSQLAFNKRLLGFRSRWSTLAEWMYFKPLRIW